MLSEIILLIGSIMCLIGSLGLIRFNDIYSRVCSQSIISLGGVTLCMSSMLLKFPFLSGKIFLLMVMTILLSLSQTYLVLELAFHKKIKM